MVPTDEYEAGKVSLGVSLLVLSLSHVCVTHVGKQAGGPTCVRTAVGVCVLRVPVSVYTRGPARGPRKEEEAGPR